MDSTSNRTAENLDEQRSRGGQLLLHTVFTGGHRLFRKMRKEADAACLYCDSTVDDTHNKFFKCARWTAERDSLEQELQ